jgi:hypothetical protein
VLEIRKFAAGDKNELPSRGLQVSQGVNRWRVDAAVLGESAVVVGGKGNEEHVHGSVGF